jgi:hypothetical protein
MASRLTINTNSLNVPFVTGTQYRITLDAGFVKEVGNNRTASPANNNLVTFTTNTAPTFSASSPSNDAFDVENNTTVQLTFNRNMEAGSGNIRLYQVLNGVDTLLYTYNMGDPAFVTFSTNTVTLKTTGLLEADSAFYLIIDNNAIRDLDNFNYAGSRIAKTITVNGNAALNSSVTKWSGVDSVIFDGVGDYLSVPSSADFGYGTGAFEISAWIRPTTSSQTSVIVDHRPTATEGLYPTLRLQSGVLQYYTNSAVRITGTTITPNTWTFVQVARFSVTTRLYVNGVQVGADYTDSNNHPTAAVKIGVNGVDLSAGFQGYMSDILIKKAPIGLGGFRTRSSVNDDYTVLAIVGNFVDLNSTIFFDTQEEALGFPSLSAAITGAFTPTMTVRYTARGQIVLASSIGLIANAGKIHSSAAATLSSTFTIATLPRADFKLQATTINCTTALTASISNLIKEGESNVTAVFTPQINVGKFQTTVPYRGLGIEQDALYFLTQGQVDSVPIGSFSFKNGHIDNNSNLNGTSQTIYFTSPTTKVLVLQNTDASGSTTQSGSIPASYILQIVITNFNELLKVRYNNGNAMTQLTDGSDNLLLQSQSRVDGTRRVYEQEILASLLFGGGSPPFQYGQIFQIGVNMSVDFATHKLVVSDSATSQKTAVLDLNDLSNFWQPYPPGSTQTYTRVAPPVRQYIQNPGAGVALTTIKGNLVSVLTPNGLKIVNYVNNTSNTFALNGTADGENIPPFIVTITNGATNYFVFSTYTTTIVGSTRNFVWTSRVYDTAGNVTQTINGPSFTVNGTSFTTADSEVYGFTYKTALMEQTSASVDGDIFILGSHTVARLGNSFQPGGWRNLVDAVSIEPKKYYFRLL